MRNCPKCGGNGSYTCHTCHGSGEVRNISYIPVLSETTSLANDWTKCNDCKGKGEKTCSRCNGSGRLNDDD